MKKLVFFIVLVMVTFMQAQTTTNQNGLQSTVTNTLSADATQAKRFEVAQVSYNSVHWQNSSVIIIELFNIRYRSGYEKYVVEIGHEQGTKTTSPEVKLMDSQGILHMARVVLGTPATHSTSAGGYPNKTIPIYVDIGAHSHYKAKITHLRDKVSSFTAHQQIIINETPTGTNIPGFESLSIKPITNSLHVKNGNSNGFKDQYALAIVEGVDSRLQILSDNSGSDGSALVLSNENSSWSFHQRTSTLDNRLDIGYRLATANQNIAGGQDAHLSLLKNGNVGIGTIDPKGYKLAVAGTKGIIAEEVTVKLKNNWPDYVFENNYDLASLKEVEKHIKEKGHLYNIPSAKEIETNGVKLGIMNAKLLEKIEELTLYTISQEKQLENQSKEIKTLKEENKVLKDLIKEVSKLKEEVKALKQ